MPKKKIEDTELISDDLLHSLLVFKQSVGWKWYETQLAAMVEQIMVEWSTTDKPSESLKGEYKAIKRCLNVINKKIEDLQSPVSKKPDFKDLDAYADTRSNSIPRKQEILS
jgi:hypothetical protein